jgi:serine protease AprX
MSLHNQGSQPDIERLNFSDRDFTIPDDSKDSAKDAPIYTYSEIVPTSEFSAQSNGASSLINFKSFRNDKRFANIKGQNFATVILDTGIDRNHPFFGADRDKNGISDRIVYQYDFADNDKDASDKTGHGSHISSIVGSSDKQYPGVAPKVDIIHLKVFGDDGGGSFSYVEEALQWVVANAKKYNIASVNMSFGDGSNYNQSTKQYGISDELAKLAQEKVAVVAAAGNDFYPYNSAQGVAYPAADSNVIAVGAVYSSNIGSASYGSGAEAYSTGADRIAPFSQRHKTLTPIFAPGAPITAANDVGGTMTLQGTSQAVPHVAGAIVLAQQLAMRELGRRLSIEELKDLLVSSGKKIKDGDNEKDNVKNTGLTFKRLDVQALGEAILKKAGKNKDNSTPDNNNPSPSTTIGEFDRVTVDSNLKTIRLDRTYNNPVIFISPLSSHESDPAIVRITDVKSDRFSVFVQEPNYKDGKHGDERFSYVVLEAGSWRLNNGARLEVGKIDTNAMTNANWASVDFQNDFYNTPVTFSQVQTDNEADFVYTRQKNSSATGFQLAMQEEEARMRSGRARETIGWMAISGGSGDWSGHNYQAGRTGDRVTHNWSDINFSQSFAKIPQILATIGTFHGSDSAGLRHQNLSTKQVEIGIEEEKSRDAETNHTDESINFFAIEGSGILRAKAYDSLTGNSTEILTGTSASDTFILGTASASYYDKDGKDDYALIEDFRRDRDVIQLHGNKADYRLGDSDGGLATGTAIFRHQEDLDELIGIVEGVDSLSLNSSAFNFV